MLVLALWTLTLLGLFSLSLGLGVRQKAALLSRLSTLDALYPIAYSGLDRARSLVRADPDKDVDNLLDEWASSAPPVREATVSGGKFSLETDTVSAVVDEERKVNLNKTTVGIVARLLERVSGLGKEKADELAYCLLDWMDSDSFFGHPQYGAEASYYEDLPKPYTAKDKPYEAFDELLLVKGMTSEIFEKIRPYVTVYGSGQVNINTAGSEVLAALGFSDLGIDTIVKYRAGEDGREGTADDRFFKNLDSVAEDLDKIGGKPLDGSQLVKLAGLITESRISVNSSVFSVMSRGTLERNGAMMDAEAVFKREGQVLYQHVGEARWPARS